MTVCPGERRVWDGIMGIWRSLLFLGAVVCHFGYAGWRFWACRLGVVGEWRQGWGGKSGGFASGILFYLGI
jgi:hypothetical protein